eukprot:CAMPEP_0117473130 /NCGR_PEP_ID=MMETSP0784-20121206/8612_1 /TAXON_ID=39447 /ORGANISM="" /LENGTH=178 /DNA_ID=CAMNT_0005267319 /DNA_START=156 /DNA_END=689 /DNA_ORIENTATION=+
MAYIEKSPVLFLALTGAAWLLDAVDGLLARWLNQCTRFGAFLDILVDNVLRATLWFGSVHLQAESSRFLIQAALIFPAVEWTCMLATQESVSGGNRTHWKNRTQDAPPLVRRIMADGFHSTFGVAVVLGLFGLPYMLCVSATIVAAGGDWAQLSLPFLRILTALLLGCRILGLRAEVW